MSRDWQKDMAHLTKEKERWQIMNIKSDVLDVGIYWLQQYKELQEECDEWKSLAESLNGDIRITNEELAKINCDYYADKQRFVVQRRELEDTTRREQKLKEALEHCIKEFPQWDSKEIAGTLMVDYMNNILSILYPKEETKP